MSSSAPQTGDLQAPAQKKPRLQTFRALQYRNFRLLWISLIVSSVGTWMQIVAQSLSMCLAFIFGILTLTGVIQVWMIVLLAFCSGTILSFDQPTRSSLIPMLVPRKDLMNAISLQSTVFNGAAVVGPALAGITIGLLANAGLFIGMTGSLN